MKTNKFKNCLLTFLPLLLMVLLSQKAQAIDVNPSGGNSQVCVVTSFVDSNEFGTFQRAYQNGYNIADSAKPSMCKEEIRFEKAGTVTLRQPVLLTNPATTGFKLTKASGVEGQVILDASKLQPGQCAITIDQADEVTISGISVRNAPNCAILIKNNSNNNVIRNGTFSNGKDGIVIESGSQGNLITQNIISDNTGIGVYLKDATQNEVTRNSIYRNGVKAIESNATSLLPEIQSWSPTNTNGSEWSIFGAVGSEIQRIELFLGAPTAEGTEASSSTFIKDILGDEILSLTFQTTFNAERGNDVFAVAIAADGTTSPSSELVNLTSTGGSNGGGVPGQGERPCFPGQVFPPTADFDGDGIKDVLEDKNADCVVGPDETDPASKDTDGDGIDDGEEDRDKNGEVGEDESDPRLTDTDEDGIDDNLEDANQDGIRQNSKESHPNKKNSDGPEPGEGIAADGEDCIPDRQEDRNLNGVCDEGETCAYLWDTDGDGLSDSDEVGCDGIRNEQTETDPTNEDTDNDGFPDGSDPCPLVPTADANGVPNGQVCTVPCIPGQLPPESLDNDGDGLPDRWEDRNSNCQLDANETSPYKWSTDDDELSDQKDPCPRNPDLECEGICNAGNINPYSDSDADGKLDVDEDVDGNCFVDATESDPFNPDTDGDGTQDGPDQCPLDPNPLCSNPCQPGVPYPEGQDSDGDGIYDADEDIDLSCTLSGNEVSAHNIRDTDKDGLNDNVDPCPSDPDLSCTKQCFPGEFIAPGRDSDQDGIFDVLEDTNKNCIKDFGETDSYNSDSDADGLPDGLEDANRNGVFDEGEETDPRFSDTDGDGISDGVEDVNKNGKADLNECNPRLLDTDSDGLVDFVEDKNANGLWDTGETNCSRNDTDQDGLADGEEDKNGNGLLEAGETDPTNPDTDGDGANDGLEVQNGTNPFEANESDLRKALGQGCSLQVGATGFAGTWSWLSLSALLTVLWFRARRLRS